MAVRAGLQPSPQGGFSSGASHHIMHIYTKVQTLGGFYSLSMSTSKLNVCKVCGGVAVY